MEGRKIVNSVDGNVTSWTGLKLEDAIRKVDNRSERRTRAQLSLGLADRTHGAHSQPASITVRVYDVSNMFLPAPKM